MLSKLLNVVFMGSSDFAVPSLHRMVQTPGIDLKVVVTVPDKPAGRSLELTESPVKTAARKLGLPVLQPEDLRDPFFIRAFQGYAPDIAAVVAFRILPTELFTLPALGCVNLHASLLPDLRGAAPIQWALMRGYKKTGVTTFLIERKVDTGGLLAQAAIDIDPLDDAGSLARKLSLIGSELLVETVAKVGRGELKPILQTGVPTTAPKITKELCRIEWSRSAEEIHNQIRGLSPLPAAQCLLNDKIIKIFSSSLTDVCDASPGELLSFKDGTLVVGTGKGVLKIDELQLEGKKRMNSADFLRGKPVPTGTLLS